MYFQHAFIMTFQAKKTLGEENWKSFSQSMLKIIHNYLSKGQLGIHDFPLTEIFGRDIEL